MNILSPRKASDAALAGHAVRVLRRSELRATVGDQSAAETLTLLQAHRASLSN